MNTASVPAQPDGRKLRRGYRSPSRERRARTTRQRILAAATSLFEARGYAGTSVHAIADAAGVAVPTVELLFGSKPRLLKAAIDVAIAGDDQPVPILERERVAHARATTTAFDLLAVVGDVVRRSMIRSAGLVVAAFEVAATDPGMRVVADELGRQRAITVGWLVDAIVARSALRPGLTHDMAVDTVWLLMDPVVFQRLTRERGWTPEQYQKWFAECVARLLLRNRGRASTSPNQLSGCDVAGPPGSGCERSDAPTARGAGRRATARPGSPSPAK
ncbi:MAG: TetR/AcrR family transcriptional regulator [Chloroflexi bacterium]|nr:TetR/AcrR family transcriptional regulator [Chloroflexota bacterium]